MPKEVVLTKITNRIEYATTDGKGFITGKREDITDQVELAAFDYYKTEFERYNSDGKGMGKNYDELGSLIYCAPGTKLVWEDEVKVSKDRIIKELENRITNERNIENNDAAFELDNFLQWYKEELSK
ncbi:hypothetical protein LCM23_06400 [Cytobacillus kochii]|uniref:DUF7446 family protein n=1 Tax=Cytobacillus kochii TaxID=859143 RepID=UPI001CD4FD98|nr:hypothetical protein [Cytobacillus kochii]MCA1025716.1 hypothetical protein [Cytobacillus kochii]